MIRGFSLMAIVWFACTAPAWPQRPSEPDPDAVLERGKQKALVYTKSLPDFVCTEVVRRFQDTRHRGNWTSVDRLTVKLTYFDQKEEHKLLLIDGKPTDQTFESIRGASGEGEFGGMLHSIFDPASEAVFHWQSWKTVKKHRVASYSFAVEASHSRYVLATGLTKDRQAIVGFHGVLDIDIETGSIIYLVYEADHIPKHLSLDYARTLVDYDFAEVGGQNYLLPSHSETEMRSAYLWSWNQMDFREYGKFASDSTINFGAGK